MKSQTIILSACLLAPTHASITLNAPDGAVLDRAGSSVAASELYLVVGSPRDDDQGSNSGSVNVYSAIDGSFIRKINPPAESVGDEFGNAIAIDGNDLLVGARFNDQEGSNAGAAYLYDLTTGDLLRKFASPSPQAGDQFGNAVSIENGNIAISAWLSDSAAAEGGAVFIFNKHHNNSVTITAPNAEDFDQFGASISLSDDQIAIGAPFRDTPSTDTGSVYLYSLDGTLIDQFSSPSSTIGANFGSAIALTESQILVGSPGAEGTGQAYLYDLGNSESRVTITSPDPQDGEKFGTSVSLLSDSFVIGAYLNDTEASTAGKAYHFDSASELITELTHPAPVTADFFGFSVSHTTQGILIGVPQRDDLGSSSGGAQYYLPSLPDQPVSDLALYPGTTPDERQLTWTPVPNVVRYSIDVSTDLKSWEPFIAETDLTSHLITIEPGRPKVFFRVATLP